MAHPTRAETYLTGLVDKGILTDPKTADARDHLKAAHEVEEELGRQWVAAKQVVDRARAAFLDASEHALFEATVTELLAGGERAPVPRHALVNPPAGWHYGLGGRHIAVVYDKTPKYAERVGTWRLVTYILVTTKGPPVKHVAAVDTVTGFEIGTTNKVVNWFAMEEMVPQ